MKAPLLKNLVTLARDWLISTFARNKMLQPNENTVSIPAAGSISVSSISVFVSTETGGHRPQLSSRKQMSPADNTLIQPHRPLDKHREGKQHIEVLGFVARGGMGRVYYAMRHEQAAFSRPVALKRIIVPETDSEHLQRRLMHEGEVGLWLNHPNVVRTLDVLSFLHQGRQEYALVIEWIQGPTLGQLLKHCKLHRTTLSPAVSTEIVRQVALGLAYCHQAPGPTGTPLRLVHRDLKPANLMLTQEGVVKIMDFGIARYEERTQLTFGNVFKGTLAFTCPEALKMHASEPSIASDIFSLGLIFYRLLMDRALVQPRTLLDAMRQMEQIPFNLQHLPEHLETLKPLLQKMLELSPERRCAEPMSIAEDLARVIHQLPGGSSYEEDLRNLIQNVPLQPPHSNHEELDKVTSWPPDVVYLPTKATEIESNVGQALEPTIQMQSHEANSIGLQSRIQAQLKILLALMAANILLLVLLILKAC